MDAFLTRISAMVLAACLLAGPWTLPAQHPVGPEPSSAAAQRSHIPQLAETAVGRGLLKYIVSCALAESQELTLEVDGATQEFPGLLGLSKDWLHAPLSESDQRWVSACLLAHVNAHGVHVPISVRGSHSALEDGMEHTETQDFPVEEAAFYGNIFSAHPVAYVCKGEQTPSRDLKDRLCAETSATPPLTECQFILTGRCMKVCSYRDSRDGYYARCQSPDGVYQEVITVYLKGE